MRKVARNNDCGGDNESNPLIPQGDEGSDATRRD